MRIHPQIHTPTNEHTGFPIRQCQKGRAKVESCGGRATPKNQPPKLTHRLALDQPRLIYDGICNLCTTATRLIHILDRGQLFGYVANQTLSRRFRKKYGLTEAMLQGQMHLIRSDGSIVSGSFVIAEICRALCPFTHVCRLMEFHKVQQLYGWIARRRYALFGCRDSCYVVHAGNFTQH